MPKQAGGSQSWAAAILLSLLTLSVFFTLQNYGPESAVRRMHEAVTRQDRQVFAEVVREPFESMQAQVVARILTRLLPASDSFRLVTMDRQINTVRIGMAYYRRGRVIGSILWVVDKKDSRVWRVNAAETLALMREYGSI